MFFCHPARFSYFPGSFRFLSKLTRSLKRFLTLFRCVRFTNFSRGTELKFLSNMLASFCHPRLSLLPLFSVQHLPISYKICPTIPSFGRSFGPYGIVLKSRRIEFFELPHKSFVSVATDMNIQLLSHSGIE